LNWPGRSACPAGLILGQDFRGEAHAGVNPLPAAARRAALFLDDLPSSRWMLAGSLFLIGLLTYAPDSLISGTAAVTSAQNEAPPLPAV